MWIDRYNEKNEQLKKNSPNENYRENLKSVNEMTGGLLESPLVVVPGKYVERKIFVQVHPEMK